MGVWPDPAHPVEQMRKPIDLSLTQLRGSLDSIGAARA